MSTGLSDACARQLKTESPDLDAGLEAWLEGTRSMDDLQAEFPKAYTWCKDFLHSEIASADAFERTCVASSHKTALWKVLNPITPPEVPNPTPWIILGVVLGGILLSVVLGSIWYGVQRARSRSRSRSGSRTT